MSMIQSDLLLGQEGGAGYVVERSLRFNASDSAYLTRTPSSAGNRKTWTWAGWVKRGSLGVNDQCLFGCSGASGDTTWLTIRFAPSTSPDSISISSDLTNFRVTNSVFRDASAWYHVLVAFDSTQASDANRCLVYINGVSQGFASSSAFTQNADYGINQAAAHSIGRTGGYFNGYLADIHFIDGQALTPSSFTEVSATTGQLIPKAYTGTFTGNSFWLKFADNSAATATTLGKDSSGLGNNWTPNNLSVTAGAGNDSLVDTPATGSQVDTGLGGQVTGNYCTLNPLANPGSSTLSNGNLDVVTASASYGKVNGTIAVSSGKWYWEVVCTVKNQDAFIGIEGVANANSDTYTGGSATGTGWYDGGSIYSNASSTSYGTTYAVNDVIGVALNMDAGTLVFYKNGVSAGTAKTGLSGSFTASVSDGATSGSGNTYVCNFGQRPFAYTAPSGFKALCDTNLPAPVVAKSSAAFQTLLWTGNGSARTITGLDFNPDLVWVKSRSDGSWHILTDSVRGVNSQLYSNDTASEGTQTDRITSFNSDGFSLGSNASGGVNSNGTSYVAWTWDAGTTTSSNGSGSITSQVRTNGYLSIVTYTAPSSGAWTVGHGLGVAPQFIITKSRSNAYQWGTYHVSVGNTGRLDLNSTGAVTTTQNSAWNNTSPTSTVFSMGSDWAGSGITYVAYCFAPVAGYSSMGSYVGNGSADGPFVYTGFRPRWIMIKHYSGSISSQSNAYWEIYDTQRDTYNAAINRLEANLSNAESQVSPSLDILSNGFKLKATGDSLNYSGGNYLYVAFAESPFAYSRAR